MTTRFNAKDAVNYNVQGVKSGYDGLKSDLFIPSCGIEDVDVAMFNLFDQEIQLSVGEANDFKKVPVIFAAGEKWALLKKGKPIRDRNNTLILPLVTIMRSQVSQQPADDIVGRGINQQTGEIVVRRRLDESDRDYQNLINKTFIENQKNVAVNINPVENQLMTARKIGDLQNELFVKRGGLLQSHRRNNIFETLVVPSPQFYTATYEISIWAQYMQHMNQIAEKVMSSFLPQGRAWKLTTPKGYWFVAMAEDSSFETETNFEDMSTSERYMKMKLSIRVPAYAWATKSPGAPVPVKRYVSYPIIKFDVSVPNAPDVPGVNEVTDNFMLGSDDPTLPLQNDANVRPDQREPGWNIRRTQRTSEDEHDANDPAAKSYPRGLSPYPYEKVMIGGETKYVRITNVNQTSGETVYAATDLEGLKLISVD
jgi:hypothetical protein